MRPGVPLLRCSLRHSSCTRWVGTFSLQVGQVVRVTGVKASWLRRFPRADMDLRLFGTATLESPGVQARAARSLDESTIIRNLDQIATRSSPKGENE